MLKNQELIYRMSLQQRIRLITSAKINESCAVDNYEFPVFKLTAHPASATGKHATVFPSDKALAATWNPALVRNVFRCEGNEAKANKESAYFNLTTSLAREGISEDYFVTAQYLAEKAKGLSDSGATYNVDFVANADDPIDLYEGAKLLADTIINAAKPDSFRVRTPDEAEGMPKLYSFGGLTYGIASTAEEVAQYLNRGCTLVFCREDISATVEGHLTSIVNEYKTAKNDYDGGRIKLVEFDRRIREGEIMDEEVIDAACDRMVSLLLDLRDKNAASVEEKPVAINAASHDPLFNEVYHDKVARVAAQQSVVLLKNKNNILPLDRETPVAVIGECASNPDYWQYKNIPTSFAVPYEEINNTSINAVGYAHGYVANESGRVDLQETALALCGKARVALVYLTAKEGATALPKGQREIVDFLYGMGVKMIAVVSADGPIDMSFTDKCEAVLFTYRGGQATVKAVFDVLTGEECPSGKLVDTFFVNPEKAKAANIKAYYAARSSDVKFPFGFGLSYTKFEYANLSIKESGITCTVYNRGNCDGYVTVQMYVQKAGSSSFLGKCVMRGYKKVFIKKNDAVKVEIPFDEATFRIYNKQRECYHVEGGLYRVLICDGNIIKLRGELKLKDHLFKDRVRVVRYVPESANSPVGFTDTQLDKVIRREKKKLSFGLRLFLALMLMIYYDGMGAALLFTNLINTKTMPFYIAIGAFLAIGNIVGIIYLAVIGKRRKLQKYMHPNEVLTDMVNRVSEFKEVAKVVYSKPVERPVTEFNPVEKEEEEEQKQEERVRRYNATFSYEESEVSFSQKVSFAELCSNFREFAAKRGVNVEVSSVRALFAAIFSGKIQIVCCKNKEMLPEFIEVLTEYFGINTRVAANDSWKSSEELLWQRGDSEEDYVLSAFSNELNAASKTTEKNSYILLENVSLKNLDSYFSSFIDYANFPSEEHIISFGDDVRLTLPKNIGFILIPAEDNFAEDLTPAIAHACILVDVIVSRAEAAASASGEGGEGEVSAKVLSRNVLEELTTEAKETYFVPEKIWKKLDDFAEAISATERFVIDNKTLLQLEKYTSILMECGGEESEALINMFTAKIVPLLKTLKTYRKDKGALTLYGIIEKLFGDENLGAIQRALLNA